MICLGFCLGCVWLASASITATRAEAHHLLLLLLFLQGVADWWSGHPSKGHVCRNMMTTPWAVSLLCLEVRVHCKRRLHPVYVLLESWATVFYRMY